MNFFQFFLTSEDKGLRQPVFKFLQQLHDYSLGMV